MFLLHRLTWKCAIHEYSDNMVAMIFKTESETCTCSYRQRRRWKKWLKPLFRFFLIDGFPLRENPMPACSVWAAIRLHEGIIFWSLVVFCHTCPLQVDPWPLHSCWKFRLFFGNHLEINWSQVCICSPTSVTQTKTATPVNYFCSLMSLIMQNTLCKIYETKTITQHVLVAIMCLFSIQAAGICMQIFHFQHSNIKKSSQLISWRGSSLCICLFGFKSLRSAHCRKSTREEEVAWWAIVHTWTYICWPPEL